MKTLRVRHRFVSNHNKIVNDESNFRSSNYGLRLAGGKLWQQTKRAWSNIEGIRKA